VREFDRRRRLIYKRLNEIEGFHCTLPSGAFYVFPNVSGNYGKQYEGKAYKNSTEFTTFLLEVGRIAVVPGVEFGSDSHVRVSYATSMASIEKGMDRMLEAIKKLQ